MQYDLSELKKKCDFKAGLGSSTVLVLCTCTMYIFIST